MQHVPVDKIMMQVLCWHWQ